MPGVAFFEFNQDRQLAKKLLILTFPLKKVELTSQSAAIPGVLRKVDKSTNKVSVTSKGVRFR
jgi:hypothetical protein